MSRRRIIPPDNQAESPHAPTTGRPIQYTILWTIMADPNLISSDKIVATVMLLKFRNRDTGQCNPSYGRVARVIGMSRETVMDAVARIKAAGYVTVHGTKGGSSRNTNQFDFHLKRTSGGPATGGAPATGGGDAERSGGTTPRGWSRLHTNYLLNHLELLLMIRLKQTDRIARYSAP